MKNFCFILCFIFLAQSQADVSGETPATISDSSANSSEDLQSSFQREYVYLVSQKEALAKQKNQMNAQMKERVSLAKSQTQSLQKELVQLTAQNDDNHESLTGLEKRKKELQKKGSSLENTYKKAHATLNEFSAGMHFESQAVKSDVVVPENLQFSDFEQLMTKSTDLFNASAQMETYPGSFLDLEDNLVEGTITRIGRTAAIGTIKDSHFVLGPNGEGLLKALEASVAPTSNSLNLFIFESLHKSAKIKRSSGVLEKMADLSPLLFLATILLLVGGLFTALIKV